jgi:FAD/FMN-containing dehydrogenase
MIGNNSAGARSILYGRTVENLLGLDALVLSRDGGAERLLFDRGAAARDNRVRTIGERVAEVVRRHAAAIRERFPKIVRHVDGYNLDLMLRQLELAECARSEAPATDLVGPPPLPAQRERDGVRAPSQLSSTSLGTSAPTISQALSALNLSSLICGSEGTLAVTLGATLNLVPLPKAKGLAVIAFATLDDAIAAVNPILTTQPSAVELLDDMVIGLARANTEYRRYVELLPAPSGGGVNAVLYVEYFSETCGEEIEERFAALRRMLPGAPISAYTDPKQMDQAWKLRKAGEPLLHGVPGHRKPLTFVEDTAVDPARLPQFVKDFRSLVERRGTKA